MTANPSLTTIKERSIQGALSYFLRTLALQGVGLISLLILSHLFRPEDFGIYGFVIMIVGLLTFISDIGLAAALIQKKSPPTLIDYRTVFTVQLFLSGLIVVAALIIIKLNLITARTGQAGNWVLLSLALSFPLATFKTIPSVILERELRFTRLVYPQILEQLVFNGILIWLAWHGWDATAYAVAVLARTLSGVLLINLLQGWSLGFALERQAFRTLFQFGLLFQVNDLLARIKDQLFYLVLGFLIPMREFGYLQWSKNWSMYPYNLTAQNVMAVTFPAFSRLQDNKRALARGIELSIFWITTLIFPILLGMALFIYPLLQVFASSYGKWLPAVPSFALFSLSIAWSAISTPLTNLLNATGQIKRTLALMIMWTTLTWTISPLFLRWFGFNGVALAAFLISFSSLAAVWLVKKELEIRVWSTLWRQLLASGAMGTFVMLGWRIWPMSWINLLIGMIGALSIYALVLFLIAKKELNHGYHALRSKS